MRLKFYARLSLSFLIVIKSNVGSSQQDLWYSLSSLSPVASIQSNPAHYQWKENEYLSINFLTLGASYGNQFGYFKNNNIFKVLAHLDQVTTPVLSQENGNIYDPDNPEIKYDLYSFHLTKPESNHDGFFTAINLDGPTFITKLKNNWTIGFLSGIKIYAGLQGIDKSINYFNYLMYIGGDHISINPMSASAPSYLYTGIHLSKQWILTSSSNLKIGSNVKYLGGLAAGYLGSLEKINTYYFVETDRQTLANGYFEYYYTHNNLDSLGKGPFIRGNGIGIDIGVTYSKKFESSTIKQITCGAAISNWGMIKFGDQLIRGNFRINDTTNIRYGLFKDDTSADELLASAKEIVESQPGNRFYSTKRGTVYDFPDLNLDCQVRLRDFASVGLYISLPLSHSAIRAPFIALSQSLNYKKFNLTVPLSYDKFAQFRLGMSVQYDFITIGTDDLRTLFNRQRLQSASIYLSTCLNLFHTPDKNKSVRSRQLKSKGTFSLNKPQNPH